MAVPSILRLLALSTALLSYSATSQRVVDGPNSKYLSSMCYPLLNSPRQINNPTGPFDLITTLSESPFPCEQMLYLETVCRANGTTPIDFLAEQQCLCGGNYFAASVGCADCYSAHGSPADYGSAWTSQISSLSKAECGPATPTQPYINLSPPNTESREAQSTTLDADYVTSADRLKSQTAVSAYYTGGARATPGAITGAATGRLTTFTNTGNVLYSPTGATTLGSGEAAAASTTASTAGAAQMTMVGGLAGMVVGAMMVL